MPTSSENSNWRWDGSQWTYWDGTSWQVGEPPQHVIDDMLGHHHEDVEPPPLPQDTTQVLPATPTPPPTPTPASGAAATPPPFQQSTSPNYKTPAPKKSKTGLVIGLIGGGVLLLLIAVVGIVMITRVLSNSDTVTLRAEPLNFTQTDPFTASVGTNATVTPMAATGSQPGNTDALYTANINTAPCDQAALIAQLQANPVAAAAWTEVAGVNAADLSGYFNGLTAFYLRTDTAVTNHDYLTGEVVSYPAVLQAGTAVMVNQFGQPVVKCNCGNPLLPPPANLTKTKFTGQSWPGLTPTSVVTITRSPVPITQFVVINMVTNTTFVRPVGTTGAADVDPNAPATAAPAPQPAPTAAPPVAPPVQEPQVVGSASVAIDFAQSLIDQCQIAVLGPGTDFLPIAQDPDVGFDAYPTGAGISMWRVDMSVYSTGDVYAFTVDVNTGDVTPANPLAADMDMLCPGVFSG